MSSKHWEELLDLISTKLNVDKTKVESLLKDEKVNQSLRGLFQTDITGILKRHKGHKVHVLYDAGDVQYDEANKHLRLLFEECGFTPIEHFVSATDFKTQLQDIPKDALIYCAISNPLDKPGQNAAASRWVWDNFTRVVGPSPQMTECCYFKSSMYEKFEKAKVPYSPFVYVYNEKSLEDKAVLDKVNSLGVPVFMKLDSGSNSEEACLVETQEEVIPKLKHVLKYGTVVIARYLSGREFTIAVTDYRAYAPIERLFSATEKFSPPNGTRKEMALSPVDPLYQTIQDYAMKAFLAVEGESYGRVDIRMDAQNKNLYVLEVNDLCSLGPNSYFGISVEAAGYSRVLVMCELFDEALTHTVKQS